VTSGIGHLHCFRLPREIMTSDGELERFQRWLQSRLADAEKIESKADRHRTVTRLQSAIQECINFRQSLEAHQAVEDPFIMRESPVRAVTEGEVRSTVSADGHCSSCNAQMAADLEFCPLCGKFE